MRVERGAAMAAVDGRAQPRGGVRRPAVPRASPPGRRATRPDVEGRRTTDVGESARSARRHHLPRPHRRRRLPVATSTESLGDNDDGGPDGSAEAAARPPAR